MPRAQTLSPDHFLTDQRLVICCGSGGVGKTTTAAALGLRAAQLGRRVLVMTIDPARRLAQALGLDALSHEPQRIQLVDAPGSLEAMMLDPKSAFDRVVVEHAPSERAREAILGNRYYQQLSASVGGSRELIGMEQVLAFVREDPERLLIVDTPPAQHALDFLDAPNRVLGLLDGSLTEAFLKPYRSIAKAQFQLFRASSTMTLKFIERITGANLITELGEFLNAFSVLFDGFRNRAEEVHTLMRTPGTGFLLICAPEPMSLREVNRFGARINAEGLEALGVLVNRAQPATVAGLDGDGEGPAATLPAMDRLMDPLLAAKVREILTDNANRVRLERASIDAYLHADADSELSAMPFRCLPAFASDLHSLADLERYAAAWRTD